MEGYCKTATRVSLARVAQIAQEQPQRGCEALLEPHLDQIAAEVIAEQAERDRDEQDALSRWFGEGGR